MLDIASRLRYAELLDPEETRQLATELDEPTLSGWTIRMALTTAELEALWSSHLNSIRLSIEDHCPGQQALILSVSDATIPFCWVIPLWEWGIWAWMEDVADTLQITILAESVEDGQYAVCGIEAFAEEDAEDLMNTAAQLKNHPKKATDIAAMTQLGLHVMLGRSRHIDEEEAMSGNLRTLVVARPINARKVMHLYNNLVYGLEKDLARLQIAVR